MIAVGKGYYSSFTISVGSEGESPTIHGNSFAIKTSNVDFITTKKNIETGEYWCKFHTISGKEIRLKVSLEELNKILQIYGNKNINYGENNVKLVE
tara:strand:+ start:6670 stop:6957 length:288 start_codon:yes stop_codon:yes gene_type:complete